LVCAEALEPMPVEVGERQSGAGVRPPAPRGSRPVQPRRSRASPAVLSTSRPPPRTANPGPPRTRSETHRPPSASVTAKSRDARPGSWPPRRSRGALQGIAQPAREPNRSATSAFSAVPARDDKRVPSARTSAVWTFQRPISFRVSRQRGGVRDSTFRSSLLRRTFQISPARWRGRD
jgi:hypothetical protein